MKRFISCEYNFDNGCVELKFIGGSIIAVENEELPYEKGPYEQCTKPVDKL